MSYRTLLVEVGSDSLCAARTQVAIRVAKEMGAHLVGLAPTGQVDLPITLDVGSVIDLVELSWKELRSRARAAAEVFRQACSDAGLASFEALVDEADPAESLVRHARRSDLCLVSQAERGTAGDIERQRTVEQVVLESARPTLVLPYAGSYPAFGGTALVAWSETREAARAVADALPMLQRARDVHLVAWSSPSAGDAERDPLRGALAETAQWLQRHGISARTWLESTELDVADALLSRVADMGVDLVVMGAYGHTRLREQVLGGVTRGVLRSMTVPVLMSH